MNRHLLAIPFFIAAASVPLACTPAPEIHETPESAAALATDSSAAMQLFLENDPSLKGVLDTAAGHVILPDVTKAAVIVGGAYGRGEAYEKGVKIGYCELSAGTIGAQLGGKSYSELVVFHDQAALDTFKKGEFTFAAGASAVVIKPNAATATAHPEGTSVFIHIKGGLMAEAAIGGQRLKFRSQ